MTHRITLLSLLLCGILFVGCKNEMNVNESITIDAPKGIVWKNISSHAKMDTWSPWNELDPSMKKSIEGTDGTVGAKSVWEGNKDVGKGSQEILAITPYESLNMNLAFIEPWESEADVHLNMKESPEGITVNWGFVSPAPFPQNIFMAIFGAEKSVSQDFQKGLGMLKALCEKEAQELPNKEYDGYKVKQIKTLPVSYIGKREIVKMEGMEDYFHSTMAKTFTDVMKAGMELNGIPSGLYYTWDVEKGETEMSIGIPVKEAKEIEGYEVINVKGGTAALIEYYGPYEESEKPHNAMADYIEAMGLRHLAPVIEEYVTDPSEEPDPNKWLTNVKYLVE